MTARSGRLLVASVAAFSIGGLGGAVTAGHAAPVGSGHPSGPHPIVTHFALHRPDTYPNGLITAVNGLVYAGTTARRLAILNPKTSHVRFVRDGAVTAILGDPKSGRVYLAGVGDTTYLTVIKGTKVVARIDGGPRHGLPRAIVVDRAAGNVDVMNSGQDSVSIAHGGQITATVAVGSQPAAMVAAGGSVYVANAGSDSVSVITGSVVTDTVSVGDAPTAMAVDPAGGPIYVADSGSDQVAIIDRATNTVTDTIQLPTGTRPSFAAALADGVFAVGLAGVDSGGTVTNAGFAELHGTSIDVLHIQNGFKTNTVGLTADPATSYVLVPEHKGVTHLVRGEAVSVPIPWKFGPAGVFDQASTSTMWVAAPGNQIDRVKLPTPPKIRIRRPHDKAVYHRGQFVLASYHCSSRTNDIASCRTWPQRIKNTYALPTNKIGQFTFEVRSAASDGQTSTRSVTYFVVPKKKH
jgi:YVTN family beta-propeller protein